MKFIKVMINFVISRNESWGGKNCNLFFTRIYSPCRFDKGRNGCRTPGRQRQDRVRVGADLDLEFGQAVDYSLFFSFCSLSLCRILRSCVLKDVGFILALL